MPTIVISWLGKILKITHTRPQLFYAQLSTKFHLVIKSKMLKNKTFLPLTLRCFSYHANNCWHFNIYEYYKFYAQLSWHEKNFITSGPGLNWYAQLSLKFQLLRPTYMLQNKDFICFKTLRCCYYPANKC